MPKLTFIFFLLVFLANIVLSFIEASDLMTDNAHSAMGWTTALIYFIATNRNK
jgi:hypothetical protein